ncbi:uncharacterized protein LOC121880013 [Homarus americanus]|uniref:uncharacterized protein LOC121880013 n=1 Tax=Homarus americanus TaxID=6706 RepID=UPI001C490529|nr:uncharacterized protein LOC121880013 [Homarus americanus]
MTPMKSLQEWAADCIAQHLLHSMCVTQLATSAFRGQIGSSQKEIIARTLKDLKLHLSSLECTASASISNPASRLLKQRIASVAEYISCQSQVNFLKASILKLLLLEEFVLSTGVEWEGRNMTWEENEDFVFEYSTSDVAYLNAFIRVLQTFGPFPVEKVVISFDFQDTDDMKSVLQALFHSCTKIRSIHLAGKSVHLVALSKLKCFSKQLEELVLIDSFGSLTKDVFCVSLLGRPWIEYISSHDGRNSCLEPQFPALKHLWYQRQNSHQNWNDSLIKTAILTYYPNLKTLNWRVNDFNHNYALTKIPGLSGKQYNLESLLLTTVDLSDSHRNSATDRLICSVHVGFLPQLFPGLQDVSLVFARGTDCQCSRCELRSPCKTRATQIIETLSNVLSECSKIESLTAVGDIVHLESILQPVLSVHGHRLKSLGLRLHSTATTTQQHIVSIVSLCANLENITITGNESYGGRLSGGHMKYKWPKVKTLQFMLNAAYLENVDLMQMFLSACCFVENLCISIFAFENLCAIINEYKADNIVVLILPVLDKVSDIDIDDHICLILKHCPKLRFIYVPRRLKRWRYLQERLWNRGVTVKFTELLANGF